MKAILIFYIFITSLVLGEEYSYVRIFNEAEKDPKWNQLTVPQQIMLVRKMASKKKTVSEPVSDRYILTAYGGPIDLVHFLMLAREATRNDIRIKDRLFKEWVSEGGRDHEFGFNPKYPCEAHPDDLPSNALGGLFGTEIKRKMSDQDFDLLEEFSKFIKPLIPLPDSLAKKFSHRRSVMGLRDKEKNDVEISRYIWFTAAPLNLTGLYNAVFKHHHGKDFCKVLKSGEACLNQAGFRLKVYKGKPILIERF